MSHKVQSNIKITLKNDKQTHLNFLLPIVLWLLKHFTFRHTHWRVNVLVLYTSVQNPDIKLFLFYNCKLTGTAVSKDSLQRFFKMSLTRHFKPFFFLLNNLLCVYYDNVSYHQTWRHITQPPERNGTAYTRNSAGYSRTLCMPSLSPFLTAHTFLRKAFLTSFSKIVVFHH